MFELKKAQKGAILIEAAFTLPLFFLLVLGIFEAHRLKVAERLVNVVALNVVSEVTARGVVNATKITNIINECHSEMDMSFFKASDANNRLRCLIEVYKNHDTAKASSVSTSWPTSQGQIAYKDSTKSIESGYTIAVTAVFKFEFLSKMTQAAYARRTDSSPFYVRKRHFMKRR